MTNRIQQRTFLSLLKKEVLKMPLFFPFNFLFCVSGYLFAF